MEDNTQTSTTVVDAGATPDAPVAVVEGTVAEEWTDERIESSLAEAKSLLDEQGAAVLRWKEVTLELLLVLHEAREHLRVQGSRSDLTSAQPCRGWEWYCEEGLHRDKSTIVIKGFPD